MDYRLALLFQTFKGLKLSAADLKHLLTDPAPVSAVEVLERLQSEPARDYFRVAPDWLGAAEHILKLSERRRVRWSYLGAADYPRAWADMRIKPILFSYIGVPVWLETPLLAVVGSRTPLNESCLWLRRELSRCLQAQEIGTVSGGARGIDQWAHRLTVAAGRPTVCVFPSGLLAPYPSGQESLWEEILLQDGCLLSTFAPEAPMRKSYFPVRNRWIAGLSHLVFIVEANRRSGTALTAKCAREEDREICTLPVSPYSAQGLANLDLLEAGATLIRDSRDLDCAIRRKLSGRAPAPEQSWRQMELSSKTVEGR